MQVELAGGVVPLPGRLPGEVDPVVRRPAAGRRVGPDVIVAQRALPACGRFDEPRMRAARVIGHEVEQHPHTALAGRFDQGIEVVDGAELGMNAQVVADVIAPILVR